MKCVSCARPLSKDEIGLTKKLINRGCQDFYCMSCLAAHFQVEERVLVEKIAYFKSIGCTLFQSQEEDRKEGAPADR